MAWARLDDGWHDHPKTIAAGLEAAGLWVMMLTWAHKQRRISPRPGTVPHDVVVRLAGSKPLAKRLTAKLENVGLLDKMDDGSWPIHDFADFLPAYDPEQARAAGSAGGRARAAKQTAKRTATKPPSGSPANHQAVSSTRASARTSPYPKEQPIPSGSGHEPAELVPSLTPDDDADALTSQHLVAEWIDHSAARPPGQVVGQVAKSIGTMLAEGIPYATVRSGLEAWSAKGVHPSALASFVHAAQNGTANRSTTDDRVRQGLDVAARLRAQEGPH